MSTTVEGIHQVPMTFRTLCHSEQGCSQQLALSYTWSAGLQPQLLSRSRLGPSLFGLCATWPLALTICHADFNTCFPTGDLASTLPFSTARENCQHFHDLQPFMGSTSCCISRALLYLLLAYRANHLILLVLPSSTSPSSHCLLPSLSLVTRWF
jgi:hypothetical protein